MSHCEVRVDSKNEAIMGLLAGFAFGATNILVGQPFDTLKTKM